MTTSRRSTFLLGMAAASTLVLTACAAGQATPTGDDDGLLSIVASTDVYGDIAAAVGGDLVEVTSIVSGATGDPHEFEPSARDQLTVADADLIIENGGGYDSFVDALIEASGTEAAVVTAVQFSQDWTGDVEGFNEHVWYDLQAISDLALGLASELETLSPADGAAFAANAEAFVAEIAQLQSTQAEIAAARDGAKVFVTEPVPYYLVRDAGLDDVTPDAFSEAVEEGNDVPPATLLESLDLVASGELALVIENAQTGGAETEQITAEASDRGIPVIAFSETLPEGQTYISWMQDNLAALSTALNG